MRQTPALVQHWPDTGGMAINPYLYGGQLGVGQALAELQCPDLAIISRDNAVLLEPGRTEANHKRAHTLIELGRLAEAILDMRKVAAATPKASMPRFMAGGLLVRQGRFNEALTEIDRGLQRNPENAEAHGVRAATLTGMASAARASAAELLAAQQANQPNQP